MINKDKLELVKKSTVVIGLVNKNGYRPKVIFGSGFFISPEGYFITAYHFFDICSQWLQFFNRKEVTVELVAFRANKIGAYLKLEIIPLSQFFALGLKTPNLRLYSGPSDVDIGIGVPNERIQK
jgi:hypothetical protein